jgi:hypothetical protein
MCAGMQLFQERKSPQGLRSSSDLMITVIMWPESLGTFDSIVL